MPDQKVQQLLSYARNAADRARQAHWNGNTEEAVEWIRRADQRLQSARRALSLAGEPDSEEDDNGTHEEFNPRVEGYPDTDDPEAPEWNFYGLDRGQAY
jgi:hypothetical protein